MFCSYLVFYSIGSFSQAQERTRFKDDMLIKKQITLYRISWGPSGLAEVLFLGSFCAHFSSLPSFLILMLATHPIEATQTVFWWSILSLSCCLLWDSLLWSDLNWFWAKVIIWKLFFMTFISWLFLCACLIRFAGSLLFQRYKLYCLSWKVLKLRCS